MSEFTSGERPRVLFLSDHLGVPKGGTDGATTYFLNTLPRLAASEIELTVCFLRERHPVADELAKSQVFPVFLDRSKWDPRALADILTLIRERDIQVVHAAGMKGILLGRRAARVTGRRVIIHLHDLNPPGRLVGALQRWSAGGTDLAFGVSRAVADRAVAEFGIPRDRVKVLYNAVAMERLAPCPGARERVRRELGIASSSPVIGIIGRLVPEKGHDTLLRAMRRVVEELPDARLLVIGDGPGRAGCERLAQRLGIAGAVHLLGFRDDVPELLAAVDLVAMPSRREGLPFTAIEAMAAGRPIVASDTGGLPEIVEHERSGLLVEPGDVSALAEAVVRVLKDPLLAERLVQGGRERLPDFTLDRHLELLIAEYRRVAAQVAPGITLKSPLSGTGPPV